MSVFLDLNSLPSLYPCKTSTCVNPNLLSHFLFTNWSSQLMLSSEVCWKFEEHERCKLRRHGYIFFIFANYLTSKGTYHWIFNIISVDMMRKAFVICCFTIKSLGRSSMQCWYWNVFSLKMFGKSRSSGKKMPQNLHRMYILEIMRPAFFYNLTSLKLYHVSLSAEFQLWIHNQFQKCTKPWW